MLHAFSSVVEANVPSIVRTALAASTASTWESKQRNKVTQAVNGKAIQASNMLSVADGAKDCSQALSVPKAIADTFVRSNAQEHIRP
jgi:hypothetical protein